MILHKKETEKIELVARPDHRSTAHCQIPPQCLGCSQHWGPCLEPGEKNRKRLILNTLKTWMIIKNICLDVSIKPCFLLYVCLDDCLAPDYFSPTQGISQSFNWACTLLNHWPGWLFNTVSTQNIALVWTLYFPLGSALMILKTHIFTWFLPGLLSSHFFFFHLKG